MRFNRKSVVVTVSSDDPVISLADMKSELRVSGTADDAAITAYIAAATVSAKEYTRRALRTETFVYRADGFTDPTADDRLMSLGAGVHTVSIPDVLGHGDTLDLPYLPIQSITSVVTYDRSNSPSTYSASKYFLDANGGRIVLNEGESWPSNLRTRNAVEVTYVAGYGAADVPAPIVQAIKMHVEGLYDGSCTGMNDQVLSRLSTYRIVDGLAW